MRARLTLIAAVASNGVIGRGGTLPWHLPDDLRHFKALTLGKPVLMGRHTFESIGTALPGRRNLVLSRSARAPIAGIEWVRSLDGARELVGDVPELCVIGGAKLYAQSLPEATRIHLTLIHADVAGDAYFPMPDLVLWREVERMSHPADERHAYALSFVTLERA